jgi:hypothetical protein
MAPKRLLASLLAFVSACGSGDSGTTSTPSNPEISANP